MLNAQSFKNKEKLILTEVAETQKRQKKKQEVSSKFQFKNLIKGEPVMDGIYQSIRLEDEVQQENCVIRLGDLKAKANKMDTWNWERFAKIKGSKNEDEEREMLNGRMK